MLYYYYQNNRQTGEMSHIDREVAMETEVTIGELSGPSAISHRADGAKCCASLSSWSSAMRTRPQIYGELSRHIRPIAPRIRMSSPRFMSQVKSSCARPKNSDGVPL